MTWSYFAAARTLSLPYGPTDLRTERGYTVVVYLQAEGKCFSANAPMGSTQILTNKTRLVAPFYDGYISLVLWTVAQSPIVSKDSKRGVDDKSTSQSRLISVLVVTPILPPDTFRMQRCSVDG